MGKKTGVLLLLMLVAANICTGIQHNSNTVSPRGCEQLPWVYGREWLLSLRRRAAPEPEPGLLEYVPEELLLRERKPRKRGRRGGIQQRLRRRYNKPPLPSILLSNARSLRNKMDELRLNTRACHEYRESCLMVYTESWLQDDFPDELIQVPGFTTVRMDRNDNSGKQRGGGICMYIRDAWCGNYTIKDTVCSPDLELLCVSLRPFHLPRDYGNIFICAVYIPPSGNASRAASRIADCVHQQLKNKPDAPLFTLGDVNHCRLEHALPGFQQYVQGSTRKDKILDKCYGNINNAYEARIRPPLSNSDHNTIILIPTYKSAIKRSKPVSRTVSVWRDNNKEELSGCFFATDWEVLHENNIDRTAEVITDYIHFCVDSTVPKKTMKVYPNNKEYITPDIINCIRRKKQAFRSNNRMELKRIQKELNEKLKVAKEQHSTRVREAFSNKSSREMWDSVREMTNMNSGKKDLHALNELEKANELNTFYKRFDCDPVRNVHECREIINSVVCDQSRHRIVIEPRDVANVFKNLHVKKSSGPDLISALLLKTFAEELTLAWTPLFQRSVDSGSIPAIWKKAVIIPIAKKPCPKENNDFRPVALTSIVMKSLERIMVGKLCAEVEHLLDPHQFAYNRGRGTDDALNSTTHLILKHLEDSSAYARLMFMDFSSAFNSILPQTLLESLREMEVNPYMIRWYCDFLIERQQKVKVNSTLSPWM